MNYRQWGHSAYLLVSVLVLITSCTVSDPVYTQRMSQLQQARQQWAAHQITNYRFNIQKLCLCNNRADKPISIEVRNGQAVSGFRAATDEQIDLALIEQYATVEKLFGVIDWNINQYADEMEIGYDPARGYPTGISVDLEEGPADDETIYMVTAFEILP